MKKGLSGIVAALMSIAGPEVVQDIFGKPTKRKPENMNMDAITKAQAKRDRRNKKRLEHLK